MKLKQTQKPKSELETCPSCGGGHVKHVRRTLELKFKGKPFTVPDVEFHECPDCGEQTFDRIAMRKIEAQSPAFAKRRPRIETNKTTSARR